MADRVSVSLSTDELRAVVTALEETLRETTAFIGSPVRDPEYLVRAYFTLIRTRKTEAGWRPRGVTIDSWAVEALADALAPAKPAKEPRAVKASPAARKRMSESARKRHARARRLSEPKGTLVGDDTSGVVVATQPEDLL